MKLFLSSPTTGQADIHYMKSVFEFQTECQKRKCGITLHLHKSSLITIGRNSCTSSFLSTDCTHMIFVDTDIQFDPKDIFRMIEADKEVILIPYPLKYYDWKKADEMYVNYKIPVNKGGFVWPIKVSNAENMVVDNGVVEIDRGPAGCMVIKREAFERLMKFYPNLKLNQKHLIDEKILTSDFSYNFWDTMYDENEGKVIGEDFAFCNRFRAAGGKVFALIDAEISHHGSTPFKARFIDEFAKIE
jgi:hypothetical protein